MALFDIFIRSELERLINLSDNKVRDEFHLGQVVGEDDYTSNLTLRIRSEIMRCLPLQVTAFSQKLPPTLERKWGVDACIILIDNNSKEYKICLFEAKENKNPWDYKQKNKKTSLSHFSTQLHRQTIPNKLGYVVWEQFYSRAPNGNSIGRTNLNGSTCILHNIAHTHKGVHPNHNVWSMNDVDYLASIQSLLPKTMGGLVKTVCECRVGVARSMMELDTFLKSEIPAKHLLFLEGGINNSSEQNLISYADSYIKNHPKHLNLAIY